MQLVFEQIRAGGDRNFGYLLGDRSARRAVLIDPSYSPEQFVSRAVDQGLTVSHVISTHGHPDHTNGNARAVNMTQARVAAHPLLNPDVSLADGDRLGVGALTLKCLHVPGHCEDHLALYEETHRILVTGDLLFVGKVGGHRPMTMPAWNGAACNASLPRFQTTQPSGPVTTTARVRRRRWPWRSRRIRFCCVAARASSFS